MLEVAPMSNQNENGGFPSDGGDRREGHGANLAPFGHALRAATPGASS